MHNLKSIIAVIAASVGLMAQAEVITPEAALQRAMSTSTMRRALGVNVNSRQIKTIEVEGQPAIYHMRDAEGNNLLLSADSEAAPLLGYFTSDAEGLNPAAEAWIQDYAAQLAAARRSGAPLRITVPKDAHAVEPMLTTKWNQDAPFNDMAPTYENASYQTVHCPSGCAPTAMAQVVYYHKYPEHGIGQRTYTDVNLNNIELSYDFENATFDYANMLDSYRNVNYTAEQGAAVANLMYACGVSANAYYGSTATGTPVEELPNGLINHFGYSKNTRLLHRRLISLEQWTQLIYEEMAAGRPVLYSGGNNEGAHEFVVDGYDGNGLFHINWGWGGTSDGYFALTGLDPVAQGIGSSEGGYNLDQTAVIGIAPPVEGEEIRPMMTCMFDWGPNSFGTWTRGYYSKIGFNVTQNVSIDGGWQNLCGETQKLTVGAKFTNVETGDVYYSWHLMESTFTPGTYTTTRMLELDLSKKGTYVGLPVGTYKCTPCCKTYSDDEGFEPEIYDAIVAVGYRQYVMITITDSQATVEAPAAPTAYPSAQNLQVLTSLFAGKPAKFTADITAGSYEYFASVTAKLVKYMADSQVTEVGSTFMSIGEGDTSEFSWSGNLPAVDPGQYYLNLYDNRGTVLTSKLVEVKEAPTATAEAQITNLRIENAHEYHAGTWYDPTKVKDRMLQVTYTVNCTSGYFTNRMYAHVMDSNYNIIHNVRAPQCYVEEGQSADHSVFIDASNIAPDTTYRIVLKQRNGTKDVQMTGGTHSFQLVTVDDATTLGEIEVAPTTTTYDLQGRRVLNPGHGIFIQGGKLIRK